MFDIPCCNEDSSDEPSAEGTRRHRGVIVVVNHSTDFGVRGVLEK